ncbi:MAG: hypothetical protein ABI395_10320 [Sphingobium sp.]
MVDTATPTPATSKTRKAPVRKSPAKAAAAAKPKVAKATVVAKGVVKSTSAKAKAKIGNAKDWKAQADQIKTQAAQAARNAAGTAKDKTGSAMQSLAKLIADTAGTVDAKLGPQYGDYTRTAAESVAGAAKSLDDKDIDQLLGEARDFVRKSPVIAVGAAAIAGFVLMRLAKGSSSDEA